MKASLPEQQSLNNLTNEPMLIKQIIGPIILRFKHFGNETYSISWVSKLTQVTTTLSKVNGSQYTIHRAWKQKKHVHEPLIEEFDTLKRALSYFLVNTDTYKVAKSVVKDAKEQVVDWIAQIEETPVTSYPKTSKAQSRIGFPVLVGEHQEREGIVLKMLPPEKPGRSPLIELRLTSGSRSGKIIRIPTNKVWIE
ncbi:hypothetical protein [Psychrobium sp. 1_MG-2023]|uniref:hypothetical protein n=1 Tax=Psychrobium sp. 1_MG-2023 TaxID=3062624 RepID=UPI002737648E|nr:hypothetical protein [Psychrobium sp. 1_MG-2023]MDP2560768.1 hypothetical protein [Psychrobium sp. 1_MG-2023]